MHCEPTTSWNINAAVVELNLALFKLNLWRRLSSNCIAWAAVSCCFNVIRLPLDVSPMMLHWMLHNVCKQSVALSMVIVLHNLGKPLLYKMLVRGIRYLQSAISTRNTNRDMDIFLRAAAVQLIPTISEGCWQQPTPNFADSGPLDLPWTVGGRQLRAQPLIKQGLMALNMAPKTLDNTPAGRWGSKFTWYYSRRNSERCGLLGKVPSLDRL